MADVVTSQTIVDGPQNAVMKFTSASDGTGESGVVKVTASALLNAPSKVKLTRVVFSTAGMAVNMLWDATTPVLIATLPADTAGTLDFSAFGGLPNNAGSGVTGNIKFTTVGASSGDSYCVVLEMRKS